MVGSEEGVTAERSVDEATPSADPPGEEVAGASADTTEGSPDEDVAIGAGTGQSPSSTERRSILGSPLGNLVTFVVVTSILSIAFIQTLDEYFWPVTDPDMLLGPIAGGFAGTVNVRESRMETTLLASMITGIPFTLWYLFVERGGVTVSALPELALGFLVVGSLSLVSGLPVVIGSWVGVGVVDRLGSGED